MSISCSDILNIENYYKIRIPESCGVVLILIGEWLLKTNLHLHLELQAKKAQQ